MAYQYDRAGRQVILSDGDYWPTQSDLCHYEYSQEQVENGATDEPTDQDPWTE